jgi:glycogen phosphorylase
MSAAESSPDPASEKGTTTRSIVEAFNRRLTYSLARDKYNASERDASRALELTVRDRLVERWFATQRTVYWQDARRVYYLSLEFLLGRLLTNNLLNLGLTDSYSGAMREAGYQLEDLAGHELDAGLGNGGLGRLAACFLDSAATLGLPFYGYGIRYEYGSFRQEIEGGEQVEAPDPWLQWGNPWEIARPDVVFPVRFYGRTEHYVDPAGNPRVRWIDTLDVLAMAYDILVPGFQTPNVNSLRLWAAKSSRAFDLRKFHSGEYVAAVEDKCTSENISRVLYPPEDQYAGRELRLKQEYFFTSATIHDIIRRFRKRAGRHHAKDVPLRWEELPDKVAIQLNDTHPAIAIPEMMRVLVDEEGVAWEAAWKICNRLFSYTNHTVLPEALESWHSSLLGNLLPRHMEIIGEIEKRNRAAVTVRHPGDELRLRKMAIINDLTGNVRMANLAIVASHTVNGVAQIHSEILRNGTFAEFHEMYPKKIVNQTNGITPRRWLGAANPELRSLLDEAIGAEWMRDLGRLRALEPLVSDAAFGERWREAKLARKRAFAGWMQREHGVLIDSERLFDVQVKRIHEYKRQLLNVMHVLHLYRRIANREVDDVVPRVVIFGGKAAPDYRFAKMVIALIHEVAAIVASDRRARERLAVHFVPNYGVSVAEMLFPATDLSEQISTAGMEASGTGCMKAIVNGGVIIGTLDGANPEIMGEVGEENIFIFGRTAGELEQFREGGYEPRSWIERCEPLARVIDDLRKIGGGRFNDIAEMLTTSDRFFHCTDFEEYVETQQRAAETWRRPEDWTRMSILNAARSGAFSSDRTVAGYARDIWRVDRVDVAE